MRGSRGFRDEVCETKNAASCGNSLMLCSFTLPIAPHMKDFRKAFPVLEERTFLDTAFSGLIHPDAHEAGEHAHQEYLKNPSDFRMDFYFNTKSAIRDSSAQFLGVDRERIALLPNFSTGMNLLLENLQVSKVMLLDEDYPSLTYPVTQRGIETVKLPGSVVSLDPKDIAKAIKSEKPDLLLVSHVHYNSGYISPIKEIAAICREAGVRFVVDGTQAILLHEVRMDEWNIDAYITSAYKWLLGGYGTGFMGISERLLKEITHRTASNNNMVFEDDGPTFQQSIRCFELGHLDHVTFSRLLKGLEIAETIGPERLRAQVDALCRQFEAGLEAIGLEPIGGWDMPRRNILCIPYSEKIEKALQEHDVVCSVRGKAIRFSIHAYNNENDIAEAQKAIASTLS